MTSVVIVNWNSGPMLGRCVRSLLAYAADSEIIIVDNNSADGSLDAVVAVKQALRIVINSVNAGFAAANNTGWRMSISGNVLFLNPDTECMEGSIRILDHTLNSTPGALAVGGALVSPSGMVQRGFNVRSFPSLGSVAADMFLLDEAWPKNPWTRRYRMSNFDHLSLREVDQPAAACLMVRRETLQRTGGFDESFFPAWFEDVDLCRRIRNAGGTILFQPAAKFVHHGGSSLERLPREKFLECYCTNLVRYFEKHHGSGEAGRVRTLVLVGMRLRAMLSLIRPPARAGSRAEAARAYWMVARRLAARQGASA
jgi:GT2 family glycosyltransferase